MAEYVIEKGEAVPDYLALGEIGEKVLEEHGYCCAYVPRTEDSIMLRREGESVSSIDDDKEGLVTIEARAPTEHEKQLLEEAE